MEDIHGVDVSWLHHPTREHHHRQRAPSAPGLAEDPRPRTSSHGGLPQNQNHKPDERKTPAPTPSAQTPSQTTSVPATPSPAQKIPSKRPGLLTRSGTSDKSGSVTPPDSKNSGRKNSWISNISSKFSSQNSPAQTTHTQAQGSSTSPNGVNGTPSSANGALNGIQAAANSNNAHPEPYVPQPPKGSFISNALRRLSSGTQVGTSGKVYPSGGVCQRRVLNIDPNRDRCLVPELQEHKLRRVAFCVDVEIAGGPRYKDEADDEDKKKKRKDKKLKERGEGEALKHAGTVADEKDTEGTVTVGADQEAVGSGKAPNPEGTVLGDEKKEPSKKKEKKKRSEAERKERKEKKRRKAEENGSIPLEITREEEDGSTDGAVETSGKTTPRHQDRPTTDPIRIYRRCCQLRETPILKRISDQLSDPSACSLVAPGVVTCLDLTGSRLQLADFVTLSDWLAVVPVKKFFLEDADLNDEKVRVILAGLLAAKPPKKILVDDVKPRSSKPEERSGVVKKLILKNNPKITAEGWTHIALFLYMCKSLVALDVSMVPFPDSSSSSFTPQTPNASQGSTSKASGDIPEIFAKATSERLGGSKLEELSMSECGLTSSSIRRIIDGCIISGVQRLGLAGNDIDDEGIGHVIHYIRSGVCKGLDLGGNALQKSMGRLAECLNKESPLWALSLADCGLTSESLKRLFPALVALPNFRFLEVSHNKDLFSNQSSLCLLRKYLPHFKELRRLHLTDVSLTPAEAIGIAEVLPECPYIAHIDILENPQIAALATATDEEGQEEAAALYTSLTMAAKVSRTLIAVNVDVPAPENNEVVKALARQVVAYCLRNMESYSEEVPELKPVQKPVEVPDVLSHLVGHTTEGYDGDHDNDAPAPDNDYIVGGIGFAKAMSYCLLQKASDLRRGSQPVSGTATPRSTRDEDQADQGKAKTMSKNLLENARNIRQRLQPALVREARTGTDMSYRRLYALDQTLQGMIQRFEDEYPETRLQLTDVGSTHSSVLSNSPPASAVPTLSTSFTDAGTQDSDEDEPRSPRSRHPSDVSLALRAQTLEEGRVHRLGHRVRTELFNPSRPTSTSPNNDQANMSGTMDMHNLPTHLVALRDHFYKYSGDELKEMSEGAGWDKAFDRIVENAEELKRLEGEDPEGFKLFRETQIAALKNRNPQIHFGEKEENDDVADGD